MPNRLAGSTSPYLLQHQDNPVDWREWGPEAFDEAERRGVPVLLTVGYAACHWCHVMAHESFEDETTAAFMNEHFVNVKVDREERPDVDAVYMEAVQAMTGHGGWPMTSFLTAKGEPFFCGTYWPRERRSGMPSFRRGAAVRRRDLADAPRRGGGGRRRRRAAPVPRTWPGDGRGHRRAARRGRREPACVVRRRARRLRRRAEVPADAGAGAAAPARGAHRRRPRAGRAHLPGDGLRRDARPARRRVRALLRRRPVGRPALREDALRQRPAPAGLHSTCGVRPAPPRPAGWPCRRPTSCCATSGRPRAASPPRSTPTPTARRA